MELKRIQARRVMSAKQLLIVPYGIETRIGTDNGSITLLLIVPYGIETL